jgi:hypothetical protein
MHGKFLAIQQNQRNSILFHETIPLSLYFFSLNLEPDLLSKEGLNRKPKSKEITGIELKNNLPVCTTQRTGPYTGHMTDLQDLSRKKNTFGFRRFCLIKVC